MQTHENAVQSNHFALQIIAFAACIEWTKNYGSFLSGELYASAIFIFLMWISSSFITNHTVSLRISLGAFLFALIGLFTLHWFVVANHIWLVAWALLPALFFSKPLSEKLFSDYMRLTLGLIMLAAAAQKLVAGTYLNGAYLAYLIENGTTTERLFAFLCSPELSYYSCYPLAIIGTSIVIWQIAIALLFFYGYISKSVFILEGLFLLGAGIFADELNFQVINIAMMFIAFRLRMNIYFFTLCLTLLCIDIITISTILDWLLQNG